MAERRKQGRYTRVLVGEPLAADVRESASPGRSVVSQ
jgi:hypothetical protein